MSTAGHGQGDPGEASLYGVLAEYETPQQLLRAASAVREMGYKRWDTFTPFPIHGIEGAMGIRPTILPWLVLGAGITGCAVAVLLQWWTNGVNYPWIVSGKPFFSLPANIPIIFELTVLFSAFTAFLGMLALNRLPQFSHPLDLKERFSRATNDRFFLLIQAQDDRFDPIETRELLAETRPLVLDDVHEDRSHPATMPKPLVYGVAVLATLALVPFALVAQARSSTTRTPRLNLVADMDFQPAFRAQAPNPFFSDARAMRGPVPGTVAVGSLRGEHLARGQIDGQWARTFPPEISVDQDTMHRGQERFNVYCAPCHGLAGAGDGMIAQRAADLAQGTWVPPTDLGQTYLQQQPVGQLFNSISNGIRNMPPYGHAITPEDRWAILLYVRALQRSRSATLADIPEEERRSLQ